MRKTLFKDLIRTIKRSVVVFTSIIFFTALCVALFTSLEWTTDDILLSVNRTLEDAKLYDIRMYYDHGLSNEDLKKISNINDVDEVILNRFGYSDFIYNDNHSVQARIIEINDSMNLPLNVEGELPKASNEVALSKKWANDNEVKIGDKIRIFNNNSVLTPLIEDELIISAFMDTPEYNELNVPGYGISEQNQLPVGCILYTSKDAFNSLIFNEGNQVLIRSEKLRNYSTFSDEYKNEVERIKDNIVSQLENSELSEFAITDRTYLPTSILPSNIILSFDSAKTILVTVFLIIGLLICYGSIIRMVSDHSYLIGTKLAMGINANEIRLQYCLYTGLAILFGDIFGGFLARFLVDKMLIVAGKNYAIPFEFSMDIKPLIVICSFEIILGIIVTLLGINFTLKMKIVDLLKGNKTIEAKKHFYEKFAFWKKIPLFNRTVINNFFNEKRRVFETLIGVVGSTVLIVVSLIMYYNCNQSFKTQYIDYFKFDSYIYYDGNEATYDEIASILDKNEIPYANVMCTRKYINNPNNQVCNTYITVYDDVESFSNLVNIVEDEEKTDKNPYNGLWVSSSYQKYHGKENTKYLNFVEKDSDFNVQVDGYFKYYLIYYQIFMDKDTYEKYMDNKVVNNAIMINLSNKNKTELLDKLIEIPGYRMFVDYYNQSHNSYKTFENLANILVVIYFVLAIVLSFMVSLSVLNMFVTEKKRELITMMINAYSPSKAKSYIFLDTAFITIVGIVLGLSFGTIIGLKCVKAFENDALTFMHELHPLIYVIAACSVFLIMLCLSLIVQRKIDKFKLSDINEDL